MPLALKASRIALLGAALMTAPPTAYAYYTLKRLEATYPPCPPETTSTPALRTPRDPKTQRTAYADIYAARVPAQALAACARLNDGNSLSLEEAWARTFMASPILDAEVRLFSLGRSAGDSGSDGFHPGQALLGGILEVLRAPAQGGQPLLVGWTMPPEPVAFFRRIARWGYPWRLMSGGRHEVSVAEVGPDGMVDVRFSAAHDYDIVEEEGDKQKTIPEWVKRCHRAYAMWLLDERAEMLRKVGTSDSQLK